MTTDYLVEWAMNKRGAALDTAERFAGWVHKYSPGDGYYIWDLWDSYGNSCKQLAVKPVESS